MTQLRAPRIAGVAGGVGTTTVATALRGYDRGRAIDLGADVLVCRSTGGSLHAAATVIAWLGAHGLPRPVLAVSSDGLMPMRGPLRARLRMIEPQVSGLVLLPYVVHWRELTDPLGEAGRLSEAPSEHLPKALRPYGEALIRLADAVLRSGLLTGAPAAASAPPFGHRASVDLSGPTRTVPTRTVPTRAVPTRGVPTHGMPTRVVPTGSSLDLPFTSAAAHGGT